MIKSRGLFFFRPLTVMLLIFFSGCEPTNTDSDNAMAVKKEKGYHYYRSFDNFNLKGIDELSGETIDSPFVAVSDKDENGDFSIKVCATPTLQFEERYVNKGNFYLKENIEHFPDEPMPYWRYLTYVQEGKETRFLHMYVAKPEATAEEKAVLAEVSIATAAGKEIYDFAFDISTPSGQANGPKIKLGPQIDVQPYQDHMIGHKSQVYRIKGDQLIIDEVYRDLELADEEAVYRTRLIYSLQDFPPFFVEYVSPMMLIERIESED